MRYEQRVVAFIDILGFKSLLNDTIGKDGNDNSDKIDEIISAYDSIREIWSVEQTAKYSDKKISATKKISIFSDCLVVSFLIEQPSGVFSTLLEIKLLIMTLISKNILCRGAISMGKFIHTDHYLFGPALVEAYTLESKAALYPRVILDHSIIDIGTKNRNKNHDLTEEQKYVQSLLEKDSDGMFYIDYFYKAQTELDDPEYSFPGYIENLANIIRKGLMSSSHHSKADIRVKYSWMRERFNNMVDIVTSKEAIIRLKNHGEDDLANFYRNLKKISPKKYNDILKNK